MSLRFSETGPIFPDALVDAVLAGDAVFLCGTGISAPQLPTFRELVDQVSAQLGVPIDESEQLAYDQNRFEEVLGSLSRRLAEPARMIRAAAAALAVPAEPRLDQHRTVLRLSRDPANRVLVITTNFDTLLERALGTLDPDTDVAAVSIAGQALPDPGSAAFSGIIHLHGRLEDAPARLAATPLVLTSADYGDAYMRSGWASRFLFDLARCKTIIVVGYSAGDAPVRFFLNVLEADRARFPDLRHVYAFDSWEHDPVEAERPWGTVAVTPIGYSKVNPENGRYDHSPLWQDLSSLADFVERPKASRAQRLRAILAQPSTTATSQVLAELGWLLAGGADPWPIAVATIDDPRWFTIFETHGFWSAPQAQWVIPAWVARNFADRARFKTAIDWQMRLGKPFIDRLAMRLQQAPPMAAVWQTGWRILTASTPPDRDAYENSVFRIKARLESGPVLTLDLEHTIALLAPVVSLRPPWGGWSADDADGDDQADAEPAGEPRHLDDLARVEFGREDHHETNELIATLADLGAHAPRILRLSSAALAAAGDRAVDLGLIDGDRDSSDFSVPSVEDHPQNEFHGGVLPLVRVIVTAFATVAGDERDQARLIAAAWPAIPGRIGTRLMLHAMRDARAFAADEAMQFLAGLDPVKFWDIRREVAMLLADRAGEADPAQVGVVEQRIRDTGDAFFSRYPVEEGQPDWRAHARDNEVWLRLSQLAVAGALSTTGAAMLAAIKVHRPHLDRALEDRDFFSSYVGSIRQVVGDAAPITSAAPDDRLGVIRELVDSGDIDQRQGWSAYCRIDPRGALDTLIGADLTPVNLALWNGLLSALSYGDDATKPLRDELAVEAVAVLAALSPEELEPVAAAITDIFLFGPRTRFADREDWYDRLWRALRLDTREIPADTALADAALNNPFGRFARILLQELETSLAGNGEFTRRQIDRITLVSADPSRAAVFARATFVNFIAFLLPVAEHFVRGDLSEFLVDEGEGPGLRAVLIGHAAITPELTRAIPDIILRAVREAHPDAGGRQSVAAAVLRPALAELRGDAEPHWGISAEQVRLVLREVSSETRKAVLDLLVRWMHAEPDGVERAWDIMVAPFLDRLWPKERRFVDQANNLPLAELAVGAGARFPEALAAVRPYLAPFSGRRGGVHGIVSSGAPANFPRQTLDLLWLLFGPTGPTSYDTPALLDRLIEIDPGIEVDRRLQSLEQRSERY